MEHMLREVLANQDHVLGSVQGTYESLWRAMVASNVMALVGRILEAWILWELVRSRKKLGRLLAGEGLPVDQR